jgi:hypothetical protein
MNTATAVQLDLPSPARPTSKTLILERLEAAPGPLAVHEFHLVGYSENNIATRLSELAKAGKVVGVRRQGQAYKEWSLTPKENIQ